MRLKLSLAVLGLLMAGIAPSLAQNNQTQQQGIYPSASVYNAPSSVPYYQTQPNGAAPVYNNGTNAQPFAMQQMIAGKNAPSYNYGGGTQAYNNFGTNSNAGGPTPMDQIQGGSYQRGLAEMVYQQQYLQAQQQAQAQQQLQQPQQNAPSAYQGNAFSQLYANATGPEKPAVPKRQRVVYKERNNPLIVPPRLFNPDE